MKQLLLFWFAIFSFLTIVSCQTSSSSEKKASVELLAPDAFMEAYHAEEQAQLIDCRTPREVSRGMVDGAVNIDFQSPNFGSEVGALDKDQPVYIYCQKGGRSAAAAKQLKGLGFKEVHDMKGGYGALKN